MRRVDTISWSVSRQRGMKRPPIGKAASKPLTSNAPGAALRLELCSEQGSRVAMATVQLLSKQLIEPPFATMIVVIVLFSPIVAIVVAVSSRTRNGLRSQ
jgi:hypothetical protein